MMLLNGAKFESKKVVSRQTLLIRLKCKFDPRVNGHPYCLVNERKSV